MRRASTNVRRPRWRQLLALCLTAALGSACSSAGGDPAGAVDPLLQARAWATDPVWYDGQAEKCVYDARRSIYGAERTYAATAYTNKQRMDPATTTKAAGGGGVEVFKHHWSERVPTENYDYDFSTAAFVEADPLRLFKLTVATQEDCGASFKQAWRDGAGLRWSDSVYFPGAGLRSGRLDAGVLSEDALPLVLRNLPFEEAPGSALEAPLLPSQKSTRQVSFQPRPAVAEHTGTETLAVPLGELEAYRVELSVDGAPHATYWFAADPELARALVRYAGRDGVVYELRSHERTAYWAR